MAENDAKNETLCTFVLLSNDLFVWLDDFWHSRRFNAVKNAVTTERSKRLQNGQQILT